MSTGKLTYFGTRGRAEVIKLILEYSGAKYDFEQVTHEEWATRKTSSPFGQLPMWQDDKVGTLAQTHAIASYLARTHNLYPTDAVGAAKVDSFIELLRDLLQSLYELIINPDFDKARPDWVKGPLEKFLTHLSKILEANKTGFFYGDKIGYVDIYAFNLFDNFIKPFAPESLKAHKALQDHRDKMAATPAIAAYLSSPRRVALTLPPHPAIKVLNTPEQCK